MLTSSFSPNDQFGMVDWTSAVNVIPNKWGTIGQLGIFTPESVTTSTVQFEEIIMDGALIIDRVRGDMSTVGRDHSRKVHSFRVPHFPLKDQILPGDLVGKRAYGSKDSVETLDAVRARKLERLRFNHAITLEAARAHCIVTGTAYSPSGTITQDWYQEFTGAARPAPVDFLFGTPATDLISKIEVCIAAIQDNSGEVSMGSGIVALCSSSFFSRLIQHPSLKEAFKFYAATQEPLRQRLSAGGSATVYRREFDFGGVRFIEMRDKFGATPLIPDGDAYFLPTGTEYFKTYYAPAERFGLVNTFGEELYVFEKRVEDKAHIFESESNHISALLKPLLVVRANSSN